jgi:hypothetical protein
MLVINKTPYCDESEQMPTMRNFIAPEAEISKVGEARIFSAPNNPQQAPRMTPPKREGDILTFPFSSFLREAARSLRRKR